MTTIRYRIGIDKEKIQNRSAEWWTDYENEQKTVLALVEQIKLDLEKWRITEAKHGSGLPPEDRLVSVDIRGQIIRAALLHLANGSGG